MASDTILYYDAEFIRKFEALKPLLEDGDRPAIYAFLLENFGFIFRANQYYAKQIAEGDAQDFEEADEQIHRELMRPLSHRQYRMIERAFLAANDEDILWSIWDFLHDNNHIYTKKAMSSAEVGGCSLILEQVYCCLARKAHSA